MVPWESAAAESLTQRQGSILLRVTMIDALFKVVDLPAHLDDKRESLHSKLWWRTRFTLTYRVVRARAGSPSVWRHAQRETTHLATTFL